MLKFIVDYQTVSAQKYDQRFREREIRYLHRKAAKFGFTISPSTTLVLAVYQHAFVRQRNRRQDLRQINLPSACFNAFANHAVSTTTMF